MELFNSLTGKTGRVEAPGPIRIYSCGPTVYERVHIGNLASFIYADTLRRALEANGFEVTHVMNITDIDDKTIKASRERYPDLPAEEALEKLTQQYESAFMDDIKAVGIDSGKIRFMRATDKDNIDSMQKLVSELVNGGIAYGADDGIYFSIEAYQGKGKKYGQLVHLDTANLEKSRINNDEYDKESPHDFALWKKQKEGEPAWDFTLNGQDFKGRPGWHIECSAMSTKALGQPFEIHTGGVDLKFPHHENEIAQSTALDGDLLANLFFHNEHMLVDNQKMSKSAGNFYTLEDVREKGVDPLAFRLFVLEGKYSSQRSFSWESLEAANSRLNRWRQFAQLRFQTNDTQPDKDPVPDAADKLKKSLADDLDTPDTLRLVDELLSHIESHGLSDIHRQPLERLLTFLDSILGLDLIDQPDISDDQKALIKQREDARANKDWEKSDRLRQELEEQGIGIKDTDSGPVWYRD